MERAAVPCRVSTTHQGHSEQVLDQDRLRDSGVLAGLHSGWMLVQRAEEEDVEEETHRGWSDCSVYPPVPAPPAAPPAARGTPPTTARPCSTQTPFARGDPPLLSMT
jgi:hypothetical protein